MAMWGDIKTALYAMVADMTTVNGYIYNWTQYSNKGIPQPNTPYLQIRTESEENIDTSNFTGVNEYRNIRSVSFYTFLKNPNAVLTLDDSVEDCEDLLELARADILKKFNSVYNAAGDAGAINIQYKGFTFEEDEKADIYTPTKLIMTYDIEYIESRQIA
jgi:hypothetical protein